MRWSHTVHYDVHYRKYTIEKSSQKRSTLQRSHHCCFQLALTTTLWSHCYFQLACKCNHSALLFPSQQNEYMSQYLYCTVRSPLILSNSFFENTMQAHCQAIPGLCLMKLCQITVATSHQNGNTELHTNAGWLVLKPTGNVQQYAAALGHMSSLKLNLVNNLISHLYKYKYNDAVNIFTCSNNCRSHKAATKTTNLYMYTHVYIQ